MNPRGFQLISMLNSTDSIWLLFLLAASRITFFALAISSVLTRPRVHDDRAEYRATIMSTDGISRRVLRNWARRVTKGVTRNFVVASRTSPGSSRAGRMMSEIASPVERSLAAASSPERAREKQFSA